MNARIAALAVFSLLAGCEHDARDTLVGTLERDRIELKVEQAEPIVAIHVADGSAVRKGDLVLEQDPARFRARLAREQALRDQAAARLAELQRGPRQELISEAQARLEAADALTANARRDFERAREIFERGLSNEADLDAARTRWENAAAQGKALREELSSLLTGTTVEELQQAAAALDASEAAVAVARVDLERLRIVAPADGILDKVLFEVGERPAPGTTVAILLDGARVYARVYVPEHLRASVRPGDTLSVALDGVPGTHRGTVSWVSSDAAFTPYFALTEHDRSRLSYLAEIELPGAADLPSGLPLEAWPGPE